jgi:hypothetical protein
VGRQPRLVHWCGPARAGVAGCPGCASQAPTNAQVRSASPAQRLRASEFLVLSKEVLRLQR